MHINEMITEIIPPSDYQHRNGFSNTHLIDKLNEMEKIEVENALISLLLSNPEDMLIVETLSYMKSEKSVPILKNILQKTQYEMSKIIISSSIFEINWDKEMIDIAINSFKKLPNIYYLIDSFYYLIKFKNPEINKIIEEYTTHKEDLVSYNAKQVLGKQ